MSYQAMAWATSIKLPMTEKIVLLMLANRSSHDDGSCYPSLNRVAEECGLDRRTVIRVIKKLEDKGLLKVVRSKKTNGENHSNKYYLILGGSVTESLGSVTESLGGSVTESPKPVIYINQSINQSVNKNISANADSAQPKKINGHKFIKPSLDEVAEYCKERGNNVNPENFIDHYTANGWKVGGNPMKDWKASVRTWERNNYGKNPGKFVMTSEVINADF